MLDLIQEEDVIGGTDALNATTISHLLYLSLAFLFEQRNSDKIKVLWKSARAQVA